MNVKDVVFKKTEENRDKTLLVLLLCEKTQNAKVCTLLTLGHLSYFCRFAMPSLCHLFSSRRCSAAHPTTLKVNNDAADFFWRESVSLLCICMFYVYYCRDESPAWTVRAILLGQFITCTVPPSKAHPHPHPSFPWKWLINISPETLFHCTIFHWIYE